MLDHLRNFEDECLCLSFLLLIIQREESPASWRDEGGQCTRWPSHFDNHTSQVVALWLSRNEHGAMLRVNVRVRVHASPCPRASTGQWLSSLGEQGGKLLIAITELNLNRGVGGAVQQPSLLRQWAPRAFELALGHAQYTVAQTRPAALPSIQNFQTYSDFACSGAHSCNGNSQRCPSEMEQTGHAQERTAAALHVTHRPKL